MTIHDPATTWDNLQTPDPDSPNTDGAGERSLDEESAFGETRDTGLPPAARKVLYRLLTQRFILRARRGVDEDWSTLLTYQEELTVRLADLFFDLTINLEEGVAFKRRTEGENVPSGLIRQERHLGREASFLLLFLRQEAAHTDPEEDTLITRDQATEFLRPYRQSGNTDDARFTSHVTTAIRQLEDLKLLKQDRDADYLYTVSPAVPALIGIEEVTELEASYTRALATAGDDDPGSGDGEREDTSVEGEVDA
jgi:hypothetical protein